MPGKQLVTLGTDGLSDWIQLSDGQKLMLGPISALKFVTEVGVGGSYGARKTLDEFIKDGTSMLMVDEDRMSALLKPHRARWTSVLPPVATPLIPPSDRHSSPPRTGTEVTAMEYEQAVKEAINNQIDRIESMIATLQTNAKEAAPGSITAEQKKKDIESLKDMVAFLRRPSVYGNQSDNSTYYGLPEKLPDGSSARSKEAAVQENSNVARNIMGTLRKVEERIDQLVLSGKRFDVARAKGDLHKVAANVRTVVEHPKFKEGGREVVIALHELGKRATQIHGLFASARV